MKKTVRLLSAAVLIAALAFAAAGCAGKADPDRQVAKIDNTVITQQDLDTYTAIDMYRQGYDLAETDDSQKQACLDDMVNAEVVRQYYEDEDNHIYDDDYNAGKNEFVSSMKSESADFIEQNNITDKDLANYYRDQFLNSRFLQEIQSEHDSAAIEEEAQKYYDKHKDDYKVSKEKRVSVILTAKKQEAQDVIGRLDNGEDFAAVAQEVSTDANSAASGGDVGYFTKSEMEKRYGKSVWKLDVGAYTESPVKTDDGYAVVKITDNNDSGYKSYDEVSQDIIYSLYSKYRDQKLDEIEKGMDIDVSDIS